MSDENKNNQMTNFKFAIGDMLTVITANRAYGMEPPEIKGKGIPLCLDVVSRRMNECYSNRQNEYHCRTQDKGLSMIWFAESELMDYPFEVFKDLK